MSTLTLSWIELPSAELGGENPHAALYQPYMPAATYMGREIRADHGMPYRQLDGYNRTRKQFYHRVAVLESDRLIAVFLLDLGGRLWSLHHKPTGRELVHVNPVFQPANFAIRNAWTSGGIEWNIGIFGHSVFTSSPVFAGKTVNPDGTDGLRIWEYERRRGAVWQLDVWAPDGSDFLYWSPRIVNKEEQSVPMYWWTCIAVNEEPEARVLAPAVTAMEPDHAAGDVPVTRDLAQEPDLTYPQRRDLPHDTYFDISAGDRPWVAQVSPNGEGVVHVSSRQLIGRKQWVWGMEPCGRRWQDWLNPGGLPYIEIQGGLAARQSEYVEMPAGADWSWLEAYGPTSQIDASDWNHSVEAVKGNLSHTLGEEEFEARLENLRRVGQTAPVEVLHQGSAYGALETKRREKRNLPPLANEATPFPNSSIGFDDFQWLQLLERGELPNIESTESPGSYVGPEWREILEAEEPKSWLTWLHLGCVYFQEGNSDKARDAWERIQPNGWAARNLGVLDMLAGNQESAAAQLLEAHRLLPEQPHLVDEICRLLTTMKDFATLAPFLSELSPALQLRPRARLAQAQLFMHQGEIDHVASYFETNCDLADIREAETTISDLWRALCERAPAHGNPAFPPQEWDFRMKH